MKPRLRAMTVSLLAAFVSSSAAAQEAPPPLLIIPAPASEPLVLAAAEHLTPLMNEALQTRTAVLSAALGDGVAACDNAACVGALIASEGGHSALLIRQHDGMLEVALVMGVTGETVTQGMRMPIPDSEDGIAPLFGEASVRRLASAVPAPPITAPVLISTNVVGAEIRVDGETVGEAPMGVIQLSPGPHQVALNAPGYDSWMRSVNVLPEGARANAWLEPSQETAAQWATDEADNPDLTQAGTTEEWHEKWWVWAAIGGGALLVAGLIAGIAVAASGDDSSGAIPVPPIPGDL